MTQYICNPNMQYNLPKQVWIRIEIAKARETLGGEWLMLVSDYDFGGIATNSPYEDRKTHTLQREIEPYNLGGIYKLGTEFMNYHNIDRSYYQLIKVTAFCKTSECLDTYDLIFKFKT